MLALLAATLLLLLPSEVAGGPGAIDITFWYGEQQVFGKLGRPQRQINILGKVQSNAELAEQTYSLDGGPELPLNWGPDTRRLYSPGDFNIELFLEDLTPGLHDIVVRAVDVNDNEQSRSMMFLLFPERVWPLPYEIDWAAVTDITTVAQPVDGHWVRVAGGIRCPTPGYDRLIAIGDMAWTDYEIRVPIRIHSVDPNGYLPPSFTPGIGIIFRWNGHTDFFKPGSQPSLGWWPLGAAGEYAYHVDQCGARLQLYGNPFVLQDQDDFCTPVEFGTWYIWKMQVRTLESGEFEYKFKVWPQSQPEPSAWKLSMIEAANQPAHGSLMFLLHHVDATIGDVTITDLRRVRAEPIGETELEPVVPTEATAGG